MFRTANNLFFNMLSIGRGAVDLDHIRERSYSARANKAVNQLQPPVQHPVALPRSRIESEHGELSRTRRTFDAVFTHFHQCEGRTHKSVPFRTSLVRGCSTILLASNSMIGVL